MNDQTDIAAGSRDGWMETYSGRRFYPFAPRFQDISILDMAHSLARRCRYGGHVRLDHYSVAEHTVLIVDHMAENGASVAQCLRALVHDGPEYVIGDMIRPIKYRMPDFRQLDHDLGRLIDRWAGLEPNDDDEAYLKDLDSRIIVDERAQAMTQSDNPWSTDGLTPLGVTIEGWPPRKAEHEFLRRWFHYSTLHLGRPVYYNYALPQEYGFIHPTHDDGAVKPADIVEVDVLGNLARVMVRGPEGMHVRDRPGLDRKWEFMEGHFSLEARQ